jgi:hypothetical protein
VNEIKENTHDALSYYYMETVRLANICDTYAKGAFEDFKLLAAVGGILTWKPFLDIFNLEKSTESAASPEISLLFLGFVAIIFIQAIVGVMNLQKQLVINFYLEQLMYFESEIRSLLGHPNSPTFRVAENWITKASRKQTKLGRIFYIIFYFAALSPTLILYKTKSGSCEWCIYLGIALTLIAMHFVAVVIVYGKNHGSTRNP